MGEFNISNLEVLQAILDAGHELQSPVLAGVAMGTLQHVRLNYLHGLMQGARSEVKMPLFFRLDHRPDFIIVKQLIEISFNSVLLDTSHLPFNENVKEVRRAVDYAHGATVEARVGEASDEEKCISREEITRLENMFQFVHQTGIDLLAFSFGSKPGCLVGESTPDLEIVRSVTFISPVFCVLLGASSIPDEFIRQAIALGAAKVIIDAYRIAMRSVREVVKNAVMEKMRLFGTENRVC